MLLEVYMSNKRDLKLEDFGISLSRYRELYYFCQQYREKKDALQRCYNIKSEPASSMPKNPKMLTDSGKQHNDKAKKLSRDIHLIEKTAQEAVGELFPFLLKNVTEDISYEHMGVPCGRRQFYFMRRKFFCLLNQKKG